MQTLLIAVAVLVLGCAGLTLVVLRRLDRLQTDMSRLAQLDTLSGQVATLTAQVERREFSVALQTKLTEFAETQARLTAAVSELQLAVAAARDRVAETRLAGADVLGVVHEHLRSQAFEGVHLLTDVASLQGGSGRVLFEARRDGVLHKGHAVLQDGHVVEDGSRAAWSTFP